jgi:predicted pyridoxine 5'-phosphate oxidase superfamily flavin-nucleotide-binding protein
MEPTAFSEDERRAQRIAGFAPASAGIRSFMTEQHREFFAHLGYLFVGVMDEEGWPLATVLTGEPGFAAAPDPTTLRIAAHPHLGDPANVGFQEGSRIGVLGLDMVTRRRNRANGIIARVDADAITIAVEQSFGNCPKYIQRREARPAARKGRPIERLDRLDAAARDLIARADTLFVASRSRDDVHEGGGADVSHRGGPPGFVRIGADVLTIPDYSGNRYMNTLGNLLGEPRAGLLFVDFERGDLLQLQGRVDVDWARDVVADLPGAERSWRFHVTRGWRRPAALPLDWTFLDFAPTSARIGGLGAARAVELVSVKPRALPSPLAGEGGRAKQ